MRRKKPTLFDIRLDEEQVVLRGTASQSPAQLIKGVVVLCLASSLRITNIQVKLVGDLQYVWNRRSFIHPLGDDTNLVLLMGRSIDLFSSSETNGTVYSEGNYEFPFEFSIPGDAIETVAGIPEASTTYRLEASVTQGGMSQDIRAVKPVRIIRTLSSWAPANLHATHIEETLPDKMQYSVLIPQREIAYGGTIPLEMRFACLQKGLEVEKIDITLFESRDFFLRVPNETVNKHQKTRQVAST